MNAVPISIYDRDGEAQFAMVQTCEPQAPGKAQCHFLWDAAEENLETEAASTAFIVRDKDLLRTPDRPRVAPEQQCFSVFDCKIRELRTAALVPCVSVP